MSRPFPFFALWLLPLLLGTVGCAGSSPPDVVVIVLDTLRPDHLGFYGYKDETAPFLASLAERSAVFRRAYSTSTWTAPATASLFTSLYPPQHGVVEGFFAHHDQQTPEGGATLSLNRFAEATVTLPMVFRDAGYETFGVATNINIGKAIGFHRGFDHFRLLHKGEVAGSSAPAGRVLRLLKKWEPRLQTKGPKFIYLHFNDPHTPYQRHEPWYSQRPRHNRRQRLVGAYDSEINYLDGVLGRIFNRFGWDQDAVVAVVSDHGEEFLEHGNVGHPTSLYGELLRVLLMISGPGVEPGSVDCNVSLVDLLPTLVDLADLETAGDWQGLSLVSLLQEQRESAANALRQRPLFAHRAEGDLELWALLRGDWKVIDRPEGPELYALDEDPLDQHDRSSERLEETSRMAALLDEFRRSISRQYLEKVPIEIDKDELEALRSLGYVN